MNSATKFGKEVKKSKKTTMASKKVINSILVLRILTLLVLAASIVVMVLNNYKSIDGTKTSFTDLHAYRYVVAVAGIGFLYTLIQIPFAVYHVCTERRWIRNNCMTHFDFYGDKLISFVLATGVGVGFGVTFEIKRFFNPFFALLEVAIGQADLDEERSNASKFLDKGLIAVGILVVGFTLMAVTSIITSLNRSSSTSSSPRKGFLFR